MNKWPLACAFASSFSQRISIALASALMWGHVLANAQGTRAGFEQARQLRQLTENKVSRARVEPQWLPGNTQFWYRVKTGAETHEFILVNAEQGKRQAAFDHAKIANALVQAGVTNARADRLPLEKVEWKLADNAMVFRAAGKSWRYELTTGELKEEPTAMQGELLTGLPLEDAPRASTRTGPETSLTFINRTQGEIELFWLDSEGERRSYGKLAVGAEREQHTYAGHVWLVGDSAGKPLAVFQAEEKPATAEIGTSQAGRKQPQSESRSRRRGRTSPRDASPDGRWRAFIKENNVWVRDTGTGSEFHLSTDGTPEDAYTDGVYWSPDSRKLVAIRRKKGEGRKVYLIESSPKDQLQPKLHSFDYDKPGDQIPVDKLQFFDVTIQKQISVSDPLFPNPWSITDLRWAPDSSHFTFLYNQRGHQVLRIIAVNAQTGEARAIVDEQSQTFINYSGNLFVEYLDESGEIIWMSERDGWNHLYLYDANTGQVKNQVTKGEWVVRGVERVDKAARQIWFRAGGIRPGQDPYHIHYGRVNLDGSGLTLLTEGDGTHTVEYSPDRRFLLDTYSRVDLPPVTELRRAIDGKLVSELERGDWSALLATGWRAPERFAAKGRDGQTDIYGIINRPTHFNPQRKYPVIENIYAGPQGSFVPKSFSALNRMQELAELGFIVVQIDGMGTAHRSKKFHDVCWKNLGDSGFPDRILWLKAAAAKYIEMDLARVGIYGTSAGGQSALRGLLAHGDFYKAGVTDCGCHDNRMDKIWWNEQWMGWPLGPHFGEQSNVTQAHRLQGKLLLMVGELDRNVDPASTMQVVNALIKADKDFELLVVPGAGHGVAGSPYGRRRLEEFFVRHLLGTSESPGLPTPAGASL